ncbi:DISARM system helicase DrmA [Demequina mangrovi]|uniref:Helicase conserved C-terminal domain-containing protein n=1 Tax=Demequina mangrovi TaxID=1043493 RepID=A0A1H6ZP09_9MICO|nr:DISARM system helicase DrmA [Demequina mangrovi]SEJ51432.1 Helicase conserved C-terminal domain-containing protein [Demequina mangrovi]
MTTPIAGTSAQVRDELGDLIARDLVGPWDGPDETIVGTPRARYLAGALAPIALLDGAATTASSTQDTTADGASDVRSDESLAVTDLSTAHEVQGVPADEDEAVGDAAAKEPDEDRGPESKIIAPSSMGLRFQVPAETGVLRFTARWGRYAARREADEQGKIQTFYDRTAFEKTAEIDISLIADGGSVERDVADDVRVSVEVFGYEGRRVVEAALLNTAVTGIELPPKLWLFQAELEVSDPDGRDVFLPTRDAMITDRASRDPEVRRLDLLYRDHLEFAVGRTASVEWDVSTADPRRATAVRTTWLPTAEVPQTQAPAVPGAVLSMRALMEASPDELTSGLTPLIDGYGTWLADREAENAELPAWLQEQGRIGLEDGEAALTRLRAGLALLVSSTQAQQAFRFMNRTMRDQRLRSQVAALRIEQKDLSVAEAVAAVDARGDKAASWRAFQLAFILMQLPSVVDPTHVRRSNDFARAELLFFPTGGGKTEAYLGLAAFTFAIRRLQGKVETPDGLLDGGDGVAVLMRYTLRLLTSQQFLRATTLMCAAELVRREDPATWGEAPFTIGLWVGSSVSPKRYSEAAKQVKDVRESDGNSAFGLTVLQFDHCPWCGTAINPKANVEADGVEKRIRVYCGERRGRCPFAAGGSAEVGLPVLTVDDEIYRHPPTFLLATVDKFARLAREGEAASLFGYVAKKCPRHGYKHLDTDSTVCGADSHNTTHANGRTYPPTQVAPVGRLRPPDLIIQDELHLITGALGTAVGLFEGAVDVLSSWELGTGDDAKPVKPLVIASTATVRKAAEQVQRLYAREVEVFPPQVLSVSDTFFSKEVPLDQAPGRRYLGVCLHGARLTLAEIRLSEILLLAGQKLFDQHGAAAEPYMTLVDYFSATRELAGMRRYLEDDVTTRVSNPDRSSEYPRRRTPLEIGELTSRISSAQIGKTLTHLASTFEADQDTTSGRAAINARLRAGEDVPYRDRPYDVVLATSMLQVGVDVPRLGLMMIVGQPKNTAEYIQASSRVGRDGEKPGLVVTLANRARPRDMAHYEQFEHYHDTFYANVEALSVTPFSEAALERGLTGLIVSAARVVEATQETAVSLSPDANAGAGRIVSRRAEIDALVDKLVARVSVAAGEEDADASASMKSKLVLRLDKWTDQATAQSGALTYAKKTLPQQHVTPLLVSPEDSIGEEGDRLFQVANSMREVQPEIDLLVSPFPGKLAEPPTATTPAWTFTAKKDAK